MGNTLQENGLDGSGVTLAPPNPILYCWLTVDGMIGEECLHVTNLI